MRPIILSVLIAIAQVAYSASVVPLDDAAWHAADLLDEGRWEEAAEASEALWKRCKDEHVTDNELRLLVLQTLCEALQYTGQTEQALAYTRVLNFTAQEAGEGYEQEQIEAMADMARLSADVANIPDAMRHASDALDKVSAHIAQNMPQWVANSDIDAIVHASEMAEDVTFACLNAVEDAYSAADEEHRSLLRDSMDLDGRIARLQTYSTSMHEMTQKAKGKRRQALGAVEAFYRHLLCHTLLLAQKMQPDDEASLLRGRMYVAEVLRVAHKNETAYIRATARMAACYALEEKYDSTLVWLKRLEQIDSDGAYRQVIEENRAWAAAVNKDWKTAMPLLRNRFEAKRNELVQDFYYMSAEARRHTWLSKYLWYFKQNIALCTGDGFPDEVHAFLYDNILAKKGVLLSTETEILSSLRKHGHSADEVCDSLYALRRSRRQMQTSADAEKYAQQLQHYLTRSHELSSLTRLLGLSYQDVQKQLGKREVAVEFVVADDERGGQMYALVLRQNWRTPKLVHLGPCNRFAVLQQRNNLLRPDLKQMVWGPILNAGHIAPGECIYFAPDGPFYMTGIEYLLVDSAHTMFDTYEMHRLSSTRELCQSKLLSPHIQSDTTVLYGGVCFDKDGAHSSVHYLPATLDEIAAIDSIVPRATLHTCYAATEQSFKSLSGNAPHVLHVATHGFFLPSKQTLYTARDMVQARLTAEGTVNVEEHALSRAGLLFAGSGAAWGQPSYNQKDDGVLTAKEIAMLDLRKTDLVVLSACQTGLGDITADGVAGLQRGFKKAGCGSMLLSLWQVNDRATKILMTEFYRQLAAGKTTTQALQQAQYSLRTFSTATSDASEKSGEVPRRARLYLRSSRMAQTEKDQYPYASPYYWAAFVLLDAK